MPLFLHGASQEDRQEVARSLHQHGSTAQGPFVIAALAEALRALRGVLLFGRSALLAEAQQTEIPVLIGNSGPSWYEAACGGTLLIDEVDCLEPTQQRQLACHLVSPTREMRFLVASRHTPEALLVPGILHPALQAWLSGLAGRQVLGPERLRAVRQLPESTSEGGASGLAAALEAPMRVYLEAALENGVQALHANVVAAAEQPLISYVMQHTQGNQLKAAALLGLNRNTLRKRLQDLNIPLGASVRRNGR